MSDETPALVGRFMLMLRQAGCRGTPPCRQASVAGTLARRDLTEINTGADALPGNWRVETAEGENGGIGRALLRPSGDAVLPTFAFARCDGFITVRTTRPEDGKTTGTLVFGVFASIVAAFDAIHNDVVTRQARIGRMLVGLA